MHIVYIANGIPFQGDNGIPMMGWGLVRGMLSRGFKVTVVGLCGKSNKFCSQEFTKNLTKLGVKVKILEYQRPELKKKSIDRKSVV